MAEACPETLLRLRVMDESRFGLRTVTRRRLTLRGIKPVCSFQQDFESLDALRRCLEGELRAWMEAPARLASLAGYPYLLRALEMLDQP